MRQPHKQMTSVLIPSSRVHLFNDSYSTLEGGSSSLPSRPRISGGETALVPVGGLEKCDMNNSKTHLYVIVNSMGAPVLSGSPARQKTYEACSPSSAATKAFYAWWRMTNQGRVAGSAEQGTAGVPLELTQRLEELDAPEDEKQTFLRLWNSVDEAQLSKQLLVRLATAGGSGAVKNYVVMYKRNTKPNRLELKRGIVVTATARRLMPDDPRPDGVVDLESFV